MYDYAYLPEVIHRRSTIYFSAYYRGIINLATKTLCIVCTLNVCPPLIEPFLTNSMAYGTWRFNGSPILPFLSRINPITRIVTYCFKIHSNIVLSSPSRPS